jgi:hypothetical protein
MKLGCRQAISPSPLNMRGDFFIFPPFFKGPGARVTGSYNFSPIYTITNSNASATSTGEIAN